MVIYHASAQQCNVNILVQLRYTDPALLCYLEIKSKLVAGIKEESGPSSYLLSTGTLVARAPGYI